MAGIFGVGYAIEGFWGAYRGDAATMKGVSNFFMLNLDFHSLNASLYLCSSSFS